MAKMKFRLTTNDGNGNRTGHHILGRTKNKKLIIAMPGDVVESDRPLDKLFRNKWERLDPEIEPATEEMIQEVEALKKELGPITLII